ncbi:MAG: phosphate acyltransferase PlsX [Deltaproteobacteria bacterium]|nr:phosphate acyltransferase PlsX [Deltaproteobacteria bacterium]
MVEIRVAVDGMGGDRAPEQPVRGSVRAVREHRIQVILSGDEQRLRAELEQQGALELLGHGLEIRHAAEIVEMDEKPAQAARKKKQSSIRVALDLVKSGEAQAMVSAGNSGAVMATALVALGRIRGVLRPAIAMSVPNINGKTVVLDLGANTEAAPEHLAQWGFMGEAYARLVDGVDRPKVGVLSNGEEDSKGSDQTRGANAILKRAPGINYGGYAEGSDVLVSDFRVIVTDGFTGNVVLKLLEGAGRFVSRFFRAEFEQSLPRKLAYLLSRAVFAKLRLMADYREYGGAPLLGIAGVVIISHGRSDDMAIMRAIMQGKRHVEVDLNGAIERIVKEHAELFKSAAQAAAPAPGSEPAESTATN